MGVSLLRCLGYCLPLPTIGCCGSIVCKETTGLVDTGVVHEARWADPRIRMEFRRCQPSRTRLVGQRICGYVSPTLIDSPRATFRVFKIERKLHGREDVPFLERVFQKLLLNFTWCVLRMTHCRFLTTPLSGGSIGRTRVAITCLKVVSWV